jgi:hypothetical protein
VERNHSVRRPARGGAVRLQHKWRITAVVVATSALLAACGPPPARHHLKSAPSTTSTPTTQPTQPTTSTPSTLGAHYSVPASINCSGDQSGALSGFLNGLPANSIVDFPKSGCYTIATSLTIDHTNQLTINGNGTTIYQSAGPKSAPVDPVMNLYENTNLTIDGLTVHGDYNGTNGGEYFEGDLGWLLEADAGVTLTDDTTEYIQGDCINVNAPDNSFVSPGDVSLNTKVSVTDSTFNSCGYHGLTIEGANGVIIRGDAFSHIGLDAMDFEFDTYSSGMTDGQPYFAAEDNIEVTDTTWEDFCGDWFASLQGQTPGVAEHNILLDDNTINPDCSEDQRAVEVEGTNPGATSAPYDFTNLAIENNTWNASDPVSSDPLGMDITYVEGLTLRGNNFPYESGDYVMQLNEVNPVTIVGNTFPGAAGILYPATNGVVSLKDCDNRYGLGAALSDVGC